MVHTKVVFEEGWSFIRGRKQCKPKHVSSGIVVLNVRWSLIRVVSQEGDYCTSVMDCLKLILGPVRLRYSDYKSHGLEFNIQERVLT